jgi:hypothetical protein
MAIAAFRWPQKQKKAAPYGAAFGSLTGVAVTYSFSSIFALFLSESM